MANAAASFYLKCTSGGYLITQGDIYIYLDLANHKHIFRDYEGFQQICTSPGPELRDLLYLYTNLKAKRFFPCLLESPYSLPPSKNRSDGVKEPARMGRDPEAPKNQEL